MGRSRSDRRTEMRAWIRQTRREVPARRRPQRRSLTIAPREMAGSAAGVALNESPADGDTSSPGTGSWPRAWARGCESSGRAPASLSLP